MKGLMTVEEAGEVFMDRSSWWAVVSAYPGGKTAYILRSMPDVTPKPFPKGRKEGNRLSICFSDGSGWRAVVSAYPGREKGVRIWMDGLRRQAQNLHGGGAYSYSDSSGKSIYGTYDLKDGEVIPTSGNRLGFSDSAIPGYGYGFGYENQGYQNQGYENQGYQNQGYENRGDDFFPSFFSNFEDLLQEAFRSNTENQRLAYNAARKAFDLSSNKAGYFPNFAARLPQPPFHGREAHRGFNNFPNFLNFAGPDFAMPNFANSAFAGSALGPGFRRQMAAIYPANPISPNVNINKISHYSDSPDGSGYRSVSSSSYASSSNVNGREVSHRGAETIVDDNGKVTKYKVEN